VIDVQFNPGSWTWPQIRSMALDAEVAGFGSIWVFDHLSGAMLHGSGMLECFSLASALASVTTTIGIGTLVVNAANRHPAIVAVAAASVQAISGGRFTLGLGAGAAPGSRWSAEHAVAGIPLGATIEERHARLGSVLDMLDGMWSAERDDSWDGFPLPRPRPPVVIGANSISLAQIAGERCDGINVAANHPRRAEFVAAAHAGLAASAHPDRPFEVSAWAPWPGDHDPEPRAPLPRELTDLGVTRLILVR
jgi:alkanesulfonate monooxygenase SsuD/methylene tetrahydromethanopterin reductase-like flavin-dependent oxidoreductase (luciferase family)